MAPDLSMVRKETATAAAWPHDEGKTIPRCAPFVQASRRVARDGKICRAGNFREAACSNSHCPPCYGKPMRTALKEHQVRTKRPVKEKVTPRMPHERDESDDSQESGPRKDIGQAYADLQQGQVDTDLRDIGGVDEVVNDRPGQPPDKVRKVGDEPKRK